MGARHLVSEVGPVKTQTLSQFYGQNFEQHLAVQHEACIREGILAWCRHISPKVKWVHGRFSCWKCHASRSQQVAQVVGDACADYVGQFTTGQALTEEAKSYTGRFQFSDLEKQQVRMLDACALNGGVALLSLELRKDPAHPERWDSAWGYHRRFCVPWSQVPWRSAGGGKGVGIDELEGWEMRGQLYLKRFLPTNGDR